MLLIKIVTTIMILALASCTNSQPVPLQNLPTEISDWPEFSIQSRVNFLEHIKRDDGSIALTTYDTSTTVRNPTDFSIHLYPKTSNCHSLGISKPLITEDKAKDVRTQWGRVDYWDSYDAVTYSRNQPTCQPSTIYLLPEDATPEMRSEWDKAPQKGQGVYALCSEHNGKQVLVCISEITDNPALAQQIFQTFRWTE